MPTLPRWTRIHCSRSSYTAFVHVHLSAVRHTKTLVNFRLYSNLLRFARKENQFLSLHCLVNTMASQYVLYQQFFDRGSYFKKNYILYMTDYKPRSLFLSTFQNKQHQWYLKQEDNVHGVHALPVSSSHTLPHASSYYPNIGVLLRILCTLPVIVTSCSLEKSFNALKHVKTDLIHKSALGTLASTKLLATSIVGTQTLACTLYACSLAWHVQYSEYSSREIIIRSFCG